MDCALIYSEVALADLQQITALVILTIVFFGMESYPALWLLRWPQQQWFEFLVNVAQSTVVSQERFFDLVQPRFQRSVGKQRRIFTKARTT